MPTLQQLLRQMPHWKTILPKGAHKVVGLIERCHTAELGYHHYRCSDPACGHVHYRYHSCRNRHCPNCGASRSRQWMEERLGELLPVKYFHVVFTLPHELCAIALGNRRQLFKLLFDASAHCLLTLCNDKKRLGATPSITAVLHTWGQQLVFHPHVHCIVSSGGVDKENQWKPLKKGSGNFLFPYKVMEPLFKKYFLDMLTKLIQKGDVKIPPQTDWKKLKNILYSKEWIMHANQPFGNASQIIEYLGRYTHKVAISNHRIQSIDEQNRVTFNYKDYNDKGKRKLMTLSGEEFLKRFALHILPKGFVRIRHYGILGNHKRKERVAKILKNMKLPLHPLPVKTPLAIRLLTMYGKDPDLCPCCGKAKLLLVSICYPVRAGPDSVMKQKQNFLQSA
jgi:hypothetical protein